MLRPKGKKAVVLGAATKSNMVCVTLLITGRCGNWRSRPNRSLAPLILQ